MRKVLFLLLIILWCRCRSSSSNRPSTINTEHVVTNTSSPTTSNVVNESETELVKEKSKQVPESFKHTDFKNFSYGRYQFPGRARTMNLRLGGGEREYELKTYDRGAFFLHNVYYADVTHDQRPEAIVLIWHVSCGGASCDGGSGLIYIYEASRNKLRRIWQYETGSLAYGCGLKSLTSAKGNVAMELFGRCKNPAREDSGSGKFIIADTTQLNFRFNGKRLIKTSMKFVSVPDRDVKNYETEIRIN